jgi:hypothetical protein
MLYMTVNCFLLLNLINIINTFSSKNFFFSITILQKKGSWDFRGQLPMDNDCPRTIVHEFPRLSIKFFEFLKLSAKNENCP